jgi:hypothetical protein
LFKHWRHRHRCCGCHAEAPACAPACEAPAAPSCDGAAPAAPAAPATPPAPEAPKPSAQKTFSAPLVNVSFRH